MNSTAKAMIEWMKDPFGKGNVTKTHDPILEAMKSTKLQAEEALRLRTQFPIGAMIGNHDFQRSKNGKSKNTVG